MSSKRYEIAVVGGGFAGAAAAITAARQGKNVLLIEKYNCLGGAAAYDLVNPFMGNWTRDPANSKVIIELSRGLFTEIVERLQAMGGAEYFAGITFNEEMLKYVLNKMALESGVKLLYQTYVTGVRMEGERVVSLDISNVSGAGVIEADCFIDATGDANLIHMAGLPYRVGREWDGLCQPMTLCFRLGNVKVTRKSDFKTRINKLYKEFQAAGKIQHPRENILVFHTLCDSILHFNTTRVVKLNPTNAEEVTRAEIIA